jgi:hypothetical protein
MTTTNLIVRSGLLLWLAALLSVSGRTAEVDTWQNKQTFSTDRADSDACQKQLNRVYYALQQYYKVKQKLPNRLSDLIPEFVYNAEELTCPYVNKTGDIIGWRSHVDGSAFDDAGTSYAYEFSTKKCNYVPGLTLRQVKLLHMKFFGFGEPIVRCFAHRPRLNLAYDGTVYESNFEWEDTFLTSREQLKAFHDTLSDTNAIMKLMSNVESGRAFDLTARQVDLSSNYNAPLFHLGRLDSRGQFLTTCPLNEEFVGGIRFDIRALIHLGGLGFPISFPLRAEDIRINVKCARIHFLHGLAASPLASLSSIPSDSTNAVYSIHFDDGRTEDFSIVYGKDVKTLWFDPGSPPEDVNRPAWVFSLAGTQPARRLYLKTWQNPYPDSLVRSLSIRSLSTNCAPLLVAITVDETNAREQSKSDKH